MVRPVAQAKGGMGVEGVRARVVGVRAWVVALVAVVIAAIGGCSGLVETPPTPDPVSFPEITGQLGRFGITVLDWTSGDAGCDDATLRPTAIRFSADGLDQAAPVELRIYIFRDRATWERRRADVDTCAAAWATDPATFEFVDASPYVVAGQGPWAPDFHAALRTGLQEASGNGG
jgi:hypothetical protein